MLLKGFWRIVSVELESAHEAIDPNNKTVDSEYDVHAAKFPEVRDL